ncbi:VOC family protein [Cellulomonas iranensis]|nr:VOC family protein [Cellulomonas iranensis]
MDRRLQIVVDAHDPRGLGAFWADVLGYVEEPPPPGFSTWEETLQGWGLPEDRWNDAYAIVDPDGGGPRLFLQKVPEGKVAKNRLHLDVGQPGRARGEEPDKAAVRARADELVARGATHVREFDDPAQGFWIVLQDPEGNEFCLV